MQWTTEITIPYIPGKQCKEFTVQDKNYYYTIMDEHARIDIAGLDIDEPCKLLFVCHFQSHEDMKKCISTSVVIENN